MLMSPKQKENVTLTWRALALVLLSWGVYEMREIKTEIRQSSDFRIEQIEKNIKNEERHMDFKSALRELDTDVRELKALYYEQRKSNI